MIKGYGYKAHDYKRCIKSYTTRGHGVRRHMELRLVYMHTYVDISRISLSFAYLYKYLYNKISHIDTHIKAHIINESMYIRFAPQTWCRFVLIIIFITTTTNASTISSVSQYDGGGWCGACGGGRVGKAARFECAKAIYRDWAGRRAVGERHVDERQHLI